MMAVKKFLKRTRARKKKIVISQVAIQQNNLENNDGTVKDSKPKKAMVIVQEIKFARALASNDKKARAKMIKKLVNWITLRSQSTFVFTETDFLRLWKGLFYCMWMSDKPLIQEELAENISNLIHCFNKKEAALLYTKCTFKTLSAEWFGIDQYRIDKFQMLARKILRQTFMMCKKRNWNDDWTFGVIKIIEELLLEPQTSFGFKFHIMEIFMEELAKVCEGNISKDLVTEILRPFAQFLAVSGDERQLRDVMKNIFRYLIIQSDIGLEYKEKFEAWRQAGYPTGNIDAMEKVEISDDEEQEEEENNEPKHLDPRAGRVNVELPGIPFDPMAIAQLLKQFQFHPGSSSKARRQLNRLITEFTELAKGKMPLGVHTVEQPKKKSADVNFKKAAKQLLEFEDKLYADSAKNRRKNKKKSEYSEIMEEEPKKKKLKKSHSLECSEKSSDENSPVDLINSEILKKKLKKKSKKLPLESKKLISDKKIDDISISTENESLSNEESSPKKKSLQKEFKVKTSKIIKKKKLKCVKNMLNGELLDGIDDFAVFKKSANLTKQKSPKNNIEMPKNVTIFPSNAAQSKKTKNRKISSEKPEIVGDIKIDNIPWLNPVISKIENVKTNLKTPPSKLPAQAKVTSMMKKHVKIALQNNTSQYTSEYFCKLRQSPQIPYDLNAKPRASILKPSPLSNPINPFYKK